jgi:hypothetical protein
LYDNIRAETTGIIPILRYIVANDDVRHVDVAVAYQSILAISNWHMRTRAYRESLYSRVQIFKEIVDFAKLALGKCTFGAWVSAEITTQHIGG